MLKSSTKSIARDVVSTIVPIEDGSEGTLLRLHRHLAMKVGETSSARGRAARGGGRLLTEDGSLSNAETGEEVQPKEKKGRRNKPMSA